MSDSGPANKARRNMLAAALATGATAPAMASLITTNASGTTVAGGLLPQPKQLFQDANCNPLIGGKIYTYAAGTLTPKTTYQDAALTIANTNPTIANSRGEVLMYGTGAYRILLKTPDGSTVYDVDNIESSRSMVDAATNQLYSTFSAGTGTQLVGEKSPATGSVVTTVHKKFLDFGISLRADYGASGNAYTGATNDTAAVQKFMNAQEIDTRTGFIPEGNYSVTDIELGNIATTGTRFPGGQGPGIYHLYGTDRERSRFVARAGTSTVLRRNNLAGTKISGFGVDGRDIAIVGVDISWILTNNPVAPSNNNVVSDIAVTGVKVLAMNADHVYDTDFRNLRLVGCPIGLSIKGTGGQHNLTNSLMTGQLICSAQNMDIAQSSLFGGVDINGNGPNFINISGTQIFPTPVSTSIPSSKWGLAIDATDSGTYGATLKLTNCYVFGGEKSHCIQGKFNHGITAENCEFSYGMTGSLFHDIAGNGVTSKPVMRLINCNFPAYGTPLGTNPTAYEWEMINCFVGGAFIRYASNKTEGFWNPVGIGLTLTVNSVGTWTRIGNLVNVFFDITIPASASTNPALISGIPFGRVGTSSSGCLGINTYGATRLTLDISGTSIAPYTPDVVIPSYQALSGVRLKGMVAYLCANPMSGV